MKLQLSPTRIMPARLRCRTLAAAHPAQALIMSAHGHVNPADAWGEDWQDSFGSMALAGSGGM